MRVNVYKTWIILFQTSMRDNNDINRLLLGVNYTWVNEVQSSHRSTITYPNSLFFWQDSLLVEYVQVHTIHTKIIFEFQKVDNAKKHYCLVYCVYPNKMSVIQIV